jgi:penicillin-binding protein activator
MHTPLFSRRQLAVFLAASTVTGCAAQSTQMLDPRADRSGYGMGLDSRDFTNAAQDSVQKMLESGALDHRGGGRYVIVISRITNDTMQRIDTDQLVKKIRVQILNSGKAVVTTAVGRTGAEDDMTMRMHELRNSQEFSKQYLSKRGEMVAPELSLSGKLIQHNNLVDSGQRVDYSFQLTLTDLHTGLAIWENETPISKLGTYRTVAW